MHVQLLGRRLCCLGIGFRQIFSMANAEYSRQDLFVLLNMCILNMILNHNDYFIHDSTISV